MPLSWTVLPTASSLALQFLSCRCSYRRYHTRRQRSQRQQQRSHTMTNEETSLAADFQIPEWPSLLAHQGRRTDPARLRRVPCRSACIQQAKARSSRTAFLLGVLLSSPSSRPEGVPLRAQRERPEDRSGHGHPAGSSRLASGGLRSVPFRAHSSLEREPVSAERAGALRVNGGMRAHARCAQGRPQRHVGRVHGLSPQGRDEVQEDRSASARPGLHSSRKGKSRRLCLASRPLQGLRCAVDSSYAEHRGRGRGNRPGVRARPVLRVPPRPRSAWIRIS